MPHKPLAASEENYKKSGAGLYGDVMMELDASVGRVLDAIKANGLDDNTLVIFSSDNGPWFGGSTAELRGMKAAQWEGGYRVPMIARWPGRIEAGSTSDHVGYFGDIFATAFFIRLHQTRGNPWEAGRFANELATRSVELPDIPAKLAGIQQFIQES